MVTATPSTQPQRRRRGRPTKDFSWTNGHRFSGYLKGHGRTRKDPGLVNKLLPTSHVWINCSCACGRYTTEHPKAIRLDHLLAEGDRATVSCGCVGKKAYKANGEAAAAKLGDATVQAVFTAFARRPGWQQVAKIAKRFGIPAWKVGACYRLWMRRLAAMADGLVEGVEAVSGLELRWVRRHGHKFSTLPTEPSELVLEDADVVDPDMRSMFGLQPLAA